jgi:hypothetical protein
VPLIPRDASPSIIVNLSGSSSRPLSLVCSWALSSVRRCMISSQRRDHHKYQTRHQSCEHCCAAVHRSVPSRRTQRASPNTASSHTDDYDKMNINSERKCANSSCSLVWHAKALSFDGAQFLSLFYSIYNILGVPYTTQESV